MDELQITAEQFGELLYDATVRRVCGIDSEEDIARSNTARCRLRKTFYGEEILKKEKGLG